MAINQNHIAEELNGIKCSIVEKNVSAERTAFLKELLEFNGYTVVIADSPTPKAAPAKPAPAALQATPATQESTPAQATTTTSTTTTVPSVQATPPSTATPPVDTPVPPTTFTVGVTNLLFNPTNALFGRLLKTPDGHRVTPDYWNQKNLIVDEEKPYFQNNNLN